MIYRDDATAKCSFQTLLSVSEKPDQFEPGTTDDSDALYSFLGPSSAPLEVLLRGCVEARRAGPSAPRHHDRHLQQEHQLCSHKGLTLFLNCAFTSPSDQFENRHESVVENLPSDRASD